MRCCVALRSTFLDSDGGYAQAGCCQAGDSQAAGRQAGEQAVVPPPIVLLSRQRTAATVGVRPPDGRQTNVRKSRPIATPLPTQNQRRQICKTEKRLTEINGGDEVV
jgi:hypothetical protein